MSPRGCGPPAWPPNRSPGRKPSPSGCTWRRCSWAASLRSALQALRSRRLTISTLLVVASAGAVALGVFEEAALLVVVFSLGEILEDYAADRARNRLRPQPA